MTEHLPRGLKQRLQRLAAPVGSVVAVSTPARELVLTFDDGPDPVGTPAVLDALAVHGATATFFVLMSRVRQHPELLARALEEGHEIGLHGPDHRRLTRFTYRDALRRTAAAKAELESVVGDRVRWFRPPYGSQTPRTWVATRRAGMVPVLWGPTTWDWRDVPQADRLEKARQGVMPGSVVLAHDGFADERDGATEDNGGLQAPDLDRFELVDKVLETYAEQGLRACSLRAALARGNLVREARFPT